MKRLIILLVMTFSSASAAIESLVWKSISLETGCAMLIVDDPARTVYISEVPLTQEWQTGDFVTFDDPYPRADKETVLRNETAEETVRTICRGGLVTENLLLIDKITDGGESLIIYLKDDPSGIQIHVDKELFCSQFHEGDSVYRVTSPHPLWPAYAEFAPSQDSDRSRMDFLVNPSSGSVSQSFYVWDL